MSKHVSGNSFRNAVVRRISTPLVVEEKQPRLEKSGIVARNEIRQCDHRAGDRHRLTGETATALYKGKTHKVELINLSGGGAMIRAPFEPRLWELLDLELGEETAIECAVRWLSDGFIGLEFAHETRIECEPQARARLLLEVIQRSFPDQHVGIDLPEERDAQQPPPRERQADAGQRGEVRHPLVWSGHISFVGSNSYPVRIRNISVTGCLVDVAISCPLGAELVLDLGNAGQLDAAVRWSNGEQAGLCFKEPFDLNCLASLKPDLTPHRWERPGFLRELDDEDSPWNEKWSRSSLSELQEKLEGYLKH